MPIDPKTGIPNLVDALTSNLNKLMKTKPKKIIPRKDYILVKPDEVEKVQQSENGVYKPQNNEQEKKFYGTVVAVGDGIEDIKKGDRCIFAALAGDPIKMGEVDYLLLHNEEILALLED